MLPARRNLGKGVVALIRRLRNAGVALIAATAAAPLELASAADLDTQIQQEAGITPVEFGSGWYLRGDIGTFHGAGTADYAIGGAQAFNDAPFFANPSIGAGVGYIFNDSVRADFTISHTSGFELGGNSSLGSCGTGFTGDCFYTTSADAAFTSFELNGYWTIGSWAGVKPYIGSGIGLALVEWDSYNSQPYCSLDPGETCAGATHSGGPTREILPSGALVTSHGRSTLGSFALMAGADYRLTDYLSLDLGYKFTRLVDFGLNDNTGSLAEIGSLSVHQIRAGLRYEVW